MASKDTFIVRTEWWAAIALLPEPHQAQMLKNLFLYHSDRECEIVLLSDLMRVAWNLIEPNLSRNISSYDKRRDTSADNGRKGGRPPNKPKEPSSEPIESGENLTEPTNPIVSVSVSDSESVPVSDPVSDLKKNNAGAQKIFQEEPQPLEAESPSHVAGSPFHFPGNPTPDDVPDPPAHIVLAVREGQGRRGLSVPTDEQVQQHFQNEWRPVELSQGKFYASLAAVYSHYVNRCATLKILNHDSQRPNAAGGGFSRGSTNTGKVLKPRTYTGKF